MKIALIGLGKMGRNIALNLRNHGYTVFAHDRDTNAVRALAEEDGITGLFTIPDLCARFPGERRVVWLMVPAGDAVDDVIAALVPCLDPGDVVIDGGNSNFRDSIRRHGLLKSREIGFLDCGTSGGTSGALRGACTMVGGAPEVFDACARVFTDISIEGGSLYCGGPGSGHFAKMVHNGIEYGMMQAIAEGFEVLERSPYDLDFEKIARLWDRGSVIRGWLMELTGNAFARDPKLDGLRGVMHASGEGKWTLETALDLGVPTPVIALSVLMRYRSQQDDTFAGKVVAALRNEFGGHAVEKK